MQPQRSHGSLSCFFCSSLLTRHQPHITFLYTISSRSSIRALSSFQLPSRFTGHDLWRQKASNHSPFRCLRLQSQVHTLHIRINSSATATRAPWPFIAMSDSDDQPLAKSKSRAACLTRSIAGVTGPLPSPFMTIKPSQSSYKNQVLSLTSTQTPKHQRVCLAR